MPWAGGNLRTRSAAARRPSLFADSGGPEVRKHVQSGIRPAWHPQAAARSGDHADAPRGEDIRHKLRRFRMPRLRLPPQQAGGAPVPSGCGVLPCGIRIREGGCRRHGLAAHGPLLVVPVHAAGGGGLPRLSPGGCQGIHRERREMLQVHRMLEGLRGRGECREEVQDLQALQGRLQPQVRGGLRALKARCQGAIGTRRPGTSASSCPIPPCGRIPSCSGPF